MQVAVYSGSFDPLHIGHLAILKYLVGVYDAVYLVVSPQNPLKSPGRESSADSRLLAAREAIGRHPELRGAVKIDDIEYSLPLPNYTIRTLEALKEREPDNSFTLVIGADNLACLRQWKDYSRILLDYGVAVYPRTGTDLREVADDLLRENPAYRIKLVNAPSVNVSSTLIRGMIALGEDAGALLM